MKLKNIQKLTIASSVNYKLEEIEKFTKYKYVVFLTNNMFTDEDFLKDMGKEAYYFVIFCNSKVEVNAIESKSRRDKSLMDNFITYYDLDKDEILVDKDKYKYVLKHIEDLQAYDFSFNKKDNRIW